jgi:Spy/CpxP family protein refolding chaperone
MHPAVIEWWHSRRAASGHGDWANCAPGGESRGWRGGCSPDDSRSASRPGDDPESGYGDGGGGGGGPFGVRRPLRFLAYKLELDEKQVATLARILDELKTERAQAEVDRRRTVSALADAVAGETFDAEKATDGAKLRVSSAERLREAVVKALQQIHAALNPDQRARLAYLIRTGTLLI